MPSLRTTLNVWQGLGEVKTLRFAAQDLYSATPTTTSDEIQLLWTVTGPEKNERIEYWYRAT